MCLILHLILSLHSQVYVYLHENNLYIESITFDQGIHSQDIHLCDFILQNWLFSIQILYNPMLAISIQSFTCGILTSNMHDNM